MTVNPLTSFTEEDFKIFAGTQQQETTLLNSIKKAWAMKKLGDLVQKPTESGFYQALSDAVPNANLNADDHHLFLLTQQPNNLRIQKAAMTELGRRIQDSTTSGFYNALVAHICSPSPSPSQKKSVTRPC